MPAAGHYITESDVLWPPGWDEAKRQQVIDRVEQQVDAILKRPYYPAPFDIRVDGNGKNRLFLNLSAPILSITRVEVEGVELPESSYTYDSYSVGITEEGYFELSGEGPLFPKGFKNVRVVGTYGSAIVPELIKKACVILAEFEIDPKSHEVANFRSESIGDYSYSKDSKTLTGVIDADKILSLFISRRGWVSVV